MFQGHLEYFYSSQLQPLCSNYSFNLIKYKYILFSIKRCQERLNIYQLLFQLEQEFAVLVLKLFQCSPAILSSWYSETAQPLLTFLQPGTDIFKATCS